MLLLLICLSLVVPFALKLFRPHSINWLEMSVHTIVMLAFVMIGWQVSRYTDTHDFEIWNGQLTSMDRNQGSYRESYQCRCRMVTTGSGENRRRVRRCDTCWRTIYTVTWSFGTTIGDIYVDRAESRSRAVYLRDDPAVYANATIGMPVSREVGYTNYIRGVNSSLFGQVENSVLDRFEDIIPQYPRVENHVHINRVLVAGEAITASFRELDRCLDNHLRELGPSHQANIVVVVTDRGPGLVGALEHAWRGGKKNDVIVVIGTSGDSINWARTITLAGNMRNSAVDVEMQSALSELGTISDQQALGDAIALVVRENFERVPMEEFEYLRHELEPPLWAVILLTLLSTGVSLLLALLFERFDFSISEIRAVIQRRRRRY